MGCEAGFCDSVFGGYTVLVTQLKVLQKEEHEADCDFAAPLHTQHV